MKKIVIIVVLFIVVGFLAYSYDGTWATAAEMKDRIDDNDNNRQKFDNNIDTVNVFMSNFVNDINQSNYEGVFNCIDPEMYGYYTPSTIEAAVMDFNDYFDNQIKDCYLLEKNGQCYIYCLKSESRSRQLKVKYEDGRFWVEDILIEHSYKARHKVERFIFAIKENNIDEVSSIMYGKSDKISKTKAQEIILGLQQHMDIDFLGYKLKNYNEENLTYILYDKNSNEYKMIYKLESTLIRIE